MGEDPKKTIESWEKAIKAYDDALALDAADEDARFNRDLVQRKLDELDAGGPAERAAAARLRPLVAEFQLKRYMQLVEELRERAV